ncbi:hypothetical protein JOC75_000459 [Metabacillus crassostreae]|uniref:hypothetical protein n=1 Tax=Metabacillus crassostreae TaxID=929098 RepID=UPI001EF8779A|nr:hypothetical protein [Metabacillus crassostreae]MBM7602489.1 hypothetical protein [Metabacillus crassostreae]
MMKQITVFLCSLLIIVGCNQSSGVQQNTELEKSIYQIVEDKNNSEIRIDSLTSFNWDKAIVFPPYTSQETMNEKLGGDYKDPSGIGSRDDIYLLVFLYEDNVVQYAEIQRQRSDFSVKELSPSNDLIKIIRYEK